MNFIVLILAVVCSVGLRAQKHLEFEGIPVDGTITSFTEKMKKIGYKVDPSSKKAPIGMRYFISPDIPNYDFLEYYTVCVKYDVRTKTVFSVSQVYEFKSTVGGLATCSRLFDETKERLSSTYVDSDSCGSSVMESLDGLPFYGVDVNNDNCETVGTIAVRVEYDSTIMPDRMFVFVEYSDSRNSQKYFKP